MDNQLSIGGLIKHCWNLIWTGSFSAGRIWRGEYWVSIMILSLLSSVISFVFLKLLGNLGQASMIIIFVVAIITTLLQIKLIIKRSHDLGKTGRYAYIPMILLVSCFIIAGVVAGSAGLFQAFQSQNVQAIIDILKSGPLALAGIIGLVLLIRSICRSFVIAFYKGNVGDNKYGSDPLLSQPVSNTNYWIVGLVAFALSMVLSTMTGENNEMMLNKYLNPANTGTIEQDLNVGEGDDMNDTKDMDDAKDMDDTDTAVDTDGSDTQKVDMTASGVDMDNLPSDTPNMDNDSGTVPAIDPMEWAGGGI